MDHLDALSRVFGADDDEIPCAVPHCQEPALGDLDGRPPEFCYRHAISVMEFREWLDAPDCGNPGRSFARSFAGWDVDSSRQF